MNNLYAALAQHAYDRPSIKAGNAAAVAEVFDDEAYVAIAGSNDVIDWASNIWAIPWRPRDLSVWVHRGFWLYSRQLLGPLSQAIGNRPVHLCGHSLGGAACVLVAAWLVNHGYEVRSLTTFGAPRVGYDGLAKLVWNVPGRRFVIDGDQVASLPPSWFAFPYVHDRAAITLPGIDGIIDHPMSGYLQALQ